MQIINSTANPAVKSVPVRHDRHNSASRSRRAGSYRAACSRIDTRCEFDRLIKSARSAGLQSRMGGHPGVRHVVDMQNETSPNRRTPPDDPQNLRHVASTNQPDLLRNAKTVTGDKSDRRRVGPGRHSHDQECGVMSPFRSGIARRPTSFYISTKNAEGVAGNNARCEIFICGIGHFHLIKLASSIEFSDGMIHVCEPGGRIKLPSNLPTLT